MSGLSHIELSALTMVRRVTRDLQRSAPMIGSDPGATLVLFSHRGAMPVSLTHVPVEQHAECIQDAVSRMRPVCYAYVAIRHAVLGDVGEQANIAMFTQSGGKFDQWPGVRRFVIVAFQGKRGERKLWVEFGSGNGSLEDVGENRVMIGEGGDVFDGVLGYGVVS
jgi:hypothetical protein